MQRSNEQEHPEQRITSLRVKLSPTWSATACLASGNLFKKKGCRKGILCKTYQKYIPSGWSIAVIFSRINAFFQCLNKAGRWSQVSKDCRISNGQRNHLFVRIRSQCHGFQYISDRIESVFCHSWSTDLSPWFGCLSSHLDDGCWMSVCFVGPNLSLLYWEEDSQVGGSTGLNCALYNQLLRLLFLQARDQSIWMSSRIFPKKYCWFLPCQWIMALALTVANFWKISPSLSPLILKKKIWTDL